MSSLFSINGSQRISSSRTTTAGSTAKSYLGNVMTESRNILVSQPAANADKHPAARLSLAGIGCGGRTITYLQLAAERPELYAVIAAADPRPERLDTAERVSRNPEFRRFENADAILAEPRLADVMVIGTQDALHREHAIRAMERGYHLLLEKPITPTLEDTLAVQAAAERYRRRVLVCHVLRYTPFYRKVKEIVESGALGGIITLNATEGVEPWHQAHSYVRGHWAVEERSSPMILAKSCHDLDIMRWLVGEPCRSVSSFGSLTHFTLANAPEGAPKRCQDGCPVADTCIYHAARYLDDQNIWLRSVCDLPDTATREELAEWIHQSPWGRCVYRCDNDVVDHQTLNLRFANDVTGTFTMTGFATGRHIEIYGTRAQLRGSVAGDYEGGTRLTVQTHGRRTGPVPCDIGIEKDGGYTGHGGGDAALIDALYDEMRVPNPDEMTSSLKASIESHRIAFAAEASRRKGETVSLHEQ